MPIDSDHSKTITNICNHLNRLDDKINLYRKEMLKMKKEFSVFKKKSCTCPLSETAETGECTFWEFGKCNHSHR